MEADKDSFCTFFFIFNVHFFLHEQKCSLKEFVPSWRVEHFGYECFLLVICEWALGVGRVPKEFLGIVFSSWPVGSVLWSYYYSSFQ